MRDMRPAFLGHFRERPDGGAALESCRQLHPAYDDSCHWIEGVRGQAIELLGLKQS